MPRRSQSIFSMFTPSIKKAHALRELFQIYIRTRFYARQNAAFVAISLVATASTTTTAAADTGQRTTDAALHAGVAVLVSNACVEVSAASAARIASATTVIEAVCVAAAMP